RPQGPLAAQTTGVERWSEEEVLRYDAATARHLELFAPMPGGEPGHTLWHHVNLGVTAPGSRRLRAWLERPLASLAAIRTRQDAVAAWLEPGTPRASFREALRGLPDLERLAARIACAKATPRDLGALRDALRRIPDLAAGLSAASPPFAGAARTRAPPPGLADGLAAALVDDPPVSSRGAA